MSEGLIAPPLGMFSQAAMMTTRLIGQLKFGRGAHRAEHCGRAAHVELHLVHGRGLLEGNPARIEGDALADQADRRARLLGAVILTDDQARRLR